MPRISARPELLAAGLAEIHRRGFAATGVQDIAAAAGVPKGSFYNHFDSKEAFGCVVVGAYLADRTASFALLAEPALAPRLRLRAHFAALQAGIAADDFAAGCLVGNLASEAASVSEPIRLTLREALARWTAAVEACLEAARAAGELHSPLPSASLALCLVMAWEGAAQRAKVDRSAAPFAAFAALLDSLLAP